MPSISPTTQQATDETSSPTDSPTVEPSIYPTRSPLPVSIEDYMECGSRIRGQLTIDETQHYYALNLNQYGNKQVVMELSGVGTSLDNLYEPLLYLRNKTLHKLTYNISNYI